MTDNQEEVLEMRLKASEKKSLCWEFLNQAAVSEVISEPSSSTMIIISIINTHTLHQTRGDRAIVGKWKHFWNRWLFLCETVNIFSNQQRTVCGYQHKPASIIYSTALWTPDTPQGTIGSHCIEKHYSLHRRICHKTTALYHIIVCVCVCVFFDWPGWTLMCTGSWLNFVLVNVFLHYIQLCLGLWSQREASRFQTFQCCLLAIYWFLLKCSDLRWHTRSLDLFTRCK